MGGVHDVSLYGDKLHITLERKMNAAEVVVQLRHAGIDIKDFREILPSLEDVFISMVKT
jgi:ABC-2 type transport system ATP-binding protein